MRPKFNRGIWNQLEKWVRNWVVKNGDAYVISGPIFGPDPKNLLIAMDRVTVPTHYFKVLVSKRGTTTYHALALVITHASDHESPFKWRFYQTNVDSVELATNLNLMPGLSASKEKVLEEKAENFDLWK
jgi:endonuclease G